ncbi:MAG: FAD-dependent oxidoreductase [Roseiarcus sp.]|uniref:oxidoreductase n=1 Tax=Roseiarcus sp. TaxID=1969460 RepID=UPI003BB0BAA1
MASLAGDAYAKVDEEVRLRGRRLRSRVYLPAHQPGLADDGLPGDRYVEYHRRRARAGLGMQITGATPVLWSEVWAGGLTLVNIDDRIIPGYRRLAAAVHAEGGLILAQLAHVGAMETTGDAIISASWTHSEITQQTSREATPDELAEIAELYRAAALRCHAGDLDGVEVTMAHGMLLASFLSPLMNRRTDRYGGDLDARTLYPREVVSAVRSAMGPDAIVGIRIPGDELVEGGIGAEEAAVLAERLVRSGEVDYVSVTAGNNTQKLARVDHWPPTPAPLAAFRHLSRAVKTAVQVPVATVGRVTTLALAEEILRSGDADLVGMVRANIADPELLPESRAGRAGSVRPCVGANVCINSLLDHKPLTCMANPDVGRPLGRTAEGWGAGRRAVVVGGGPAGLEAARRLSIGGWRTIVLEREPRLGGQMTLWSETPSRIEFLQLVNWWAGECQRLGVEVHTSAEADAALLTRLAPDLVVVATGSRPVEAPVPQEGNEVSQIGPYDPIPTGGHVLVRDEMGRLAALLTAEQASLGAVRVTLVTSLLYPGEGDGLTTVYPLIRDVAARGVTMIDRAKVTAIDGRRVLLKGLFGEARPPVEDVDAVVAVVGAVSVADLAIEARRAGLTVVTIGDAHLPRDVTSAVSHAARLLDGLANSPSDALGVSIAGASAMSIP